MNLNELTQQALKRESFKKEYEKYDLAFEIGQMVIEARILKGVTQARLASLIKTKQPSIARLENGKTAPSLSLLERIAKALDTYLLAPRFAFLDAKLNSLQSSSNINIYIIPNINKEIPYMSHGWTQSISAITSSTYSNNLQLA